MAWAAGPALATLEGKSTIAAGAPGRDLAPDFPREEPLCRGGSTWGQLGPGRVTLRGQGLGLEALLVHWVPGETEARAGSEGGRGKGRDWGQMRNPPIVTPTPGRAKTLPTQRPWLCSSSSSSSSVGYGNLGDFILVRGKEES